MSLCVFRFNLSMYISYFSSQNLDNYRVFSINFPLLTFLFFQKVYTISLQFLRDLREEEREEEREDTLM